MSLHKIQQKILQLLKEKGSFKNITLRDLGGFIGEEHPQKIKYHLSKLKEKGFINISDSDSDGRNISLAKNNSHLRKVPIIGLADCGESLIFADENIEGYLKVSNEMFSKMGDIFIIKAIGNSMNQAKINNKNIEDGDYLFVKNTKNIEDGDYVLAIVEETATVKKFKKTSDGKIVLKPESTADYPPIYLLPGDDFYINGKIVDILKK